MANKIQDWIKAGTGVVAIITAALTLISWVNQSYLSYLEDHFATKQDMVKIEHKIDVLLQRVDNHRRK